MESLNEAFWLKCSGEYQMFLEHALRALKFLRLWVKRVQTQEQGHQLRFKLNYVEIVIGLWQNISGQTNYSIPNVTSW